MTGVQERAKMMIEGKCIHLAAGELGSKTDGGSNDLAATLSLLSKIAKKCSSAIFSTEGENKM